MPEHILYGSRGSGSAVAELALEWAGLPFRIVNAAQWEPGPGFEALKEVNPLAQIPTLVLPIVTALIALEEIWLLGFKDSLVSVNQVCNFISQLHGQSLKA